MIQYAPLCNMYWQWINNNLLLLVAVVNIIYCRLVCEPQWFDHFATNESLKSWSCVCFKLYWSKDVWMEFLCFFSDTDWLINCIILCQAQASYCKNEYFAHIWQTHCSVWVSCQQLWNLLYIQIPAIFILNILLISGRHTAQCKLVVSNCWICCTSQ
jgi:hypothetical protein